MILDFFQYLRQAFALLGEPAGHQTILISRLRWLGAYVRPQAGALVLATMLVAISAVLGMAVPFGTMLVLDWAVPRKDAGVLAALVVLLALAHVARAVLLLITDYMFTAVGQAIGTKVREDVFRHVLYLPLRYFDANQSGYVSARINEAQGVTVLVSPFLLSPLLGTLDMVGSLALMTYISWRLTVVVLLLMPIVYMIVRVERAGIRASTGTVLQQSALVANQIQECLSGVRTIKEHAAEERQSRRVTGEIRGLIEANIVQTVAGSLATQIVTVVIGLAGVVVVWIGGYGIMTGRMTVGSYVAYAMYLAKFLGPAHALSFMTLSLERNLVGLCRVSELLAEPGETAVDQRERIHRANLGGTIRFNEVGFSYPGSLDRVLRHISFEVTPGERVALVGPSGSGKTTLVRLLLGLYDPSSGSITIDGVDMGTLSLSDLRAQIGIVSQNVFLFNDTVLNNIRFSRPAAILNEVMAAARAADAEGFIEKLPKGYDTLTGEEGTRLSGGQRQRISIARAILKEPRLVIFDEATSQLDGASERVVWANIRRLFPSQTQIVITHRAAGVLQADRVLLLENGAIVDTGSATELIARSTRFRDLLNHPLAGDVTGTGVA